MADADLAQALMQDSDFLLDMCRFSEGIYTEAAIRKKYRLEESDWVTLGEDDELVRKIEAEKIRRVRDGSCKRERAQQFVTEAPRVMNGIMLDDKASPKHKIDAAKTLDGFAANGPQGVPAADRFQITIVLSADGNEHVETYDKPRKPIGPTIDSDAVDTTPQKLIEDGDGQNNF
jgi:hypothetical protein